jgi:hypothetical protein
MPRKPVKSKRARGLHPNLIAWLRDEWPLPVPDEALELALDDFRPGHTPEEIWAHYNPGKEFVHPWTWYGRRKSEPAKDV